jgi:LytS/YehU family sensor histidine kinase
MEFLKISLMFWGIYALVALSRARRENEDARLRTARLEKMLSAARLQALQRQVHPHFLFNTLNTISSAMYEDVGAADRMIVNLAGLLRLTLDAPADEHPLSREIELVRHYAEIMKARFRDKLALAIDVGPDTEGAMVPAFILQPLVENSIKYGAAATGSADVRIVVRRDGRRFLMTVEDRGPGLGEKGAASGAGGVGLSNIAERLDALYGSEGRLDLRNLAEGGLRATIDIPFRTRDAGEAAR